MSDSETQDIVRKRIADWLEEGSVLEILDLRGLGLHEIPVLPENIQRIWLQDNNIKRVHMLPQNLTFLNIRDNNLESIDTEFPETITALSLTRNKLQSLPYLPDSIEHIDILYNNITSLPNIPSKLNRLYCWGNPLPSVLIESDTTWRLDVVQESHADRINLWKQFINK